MPLKFDVERFGKQNTQYLDLLSILNKARLGLSAEQANLASQPAKSAIAQLLRQLDLIAGMVRFPHAILLAMEGQVEGSMSAFRALLEVMARKNAASGKGVSKRKRFEKQAKTTMRKFFWLDKNQSGSLSRPWLFAVNAYIWTAFESFATDLWTGALNQATPLAHRALNCTSNDDKEQVGISRRHIEVGLAARYGFDLRRSLGTILKAKFDFTSFDGIESAYTQAFGNCGELGDWKDTMGRLEQIRHLILHRGGIVDDKFLKTTKIKARRNAFIAITIPQTAEHMMSMVMASISLLKIVEGWFVTHKELSFPSRRHL